MSYLEELLPEFRKGAKIRLSTWDEGAYIVINKGLCKDYYGDLFDFETFDFFRENWELYQEPESEPDWDYIIKNKCLCWFWDKREDYKIAGILEKYFNLNNISRFIANIYEEEAGFRYCRPVHRDEVTFYEDKKDE